MVSYVRHCISRCSKDGRIPVLLIEPHPLAACQLVTLLSQDRRFKLLQQRDITDAIERARDNTCMVVIDQGSLATSIDMCIASLRSRLRNIRMLVIGPQPDVAELSRMMFLGVWGFVDYGNVATKLNQAILSVWSGRGWISSEVLQRIPEHLQKHEHQDGLIELTPKERLIIERLGRRLSNKEIANELSITERTVKFHLENIFGKLGVRDRYSVTKLLQLQNFSDLFNAVPTGIALRLHETARLNWARSRH